MELDGKSILVTGASGKIGRQLLYELDQRDIKPIAHVRESSDTTYIDSLGLEKRVADLRDTDALAGLVEGVDIVIHTAAYVDFRRDRLTQFTGLNTMGAVNLFHAAQKAGVKRFLQVSSVVAIGAVHRREEKERLGHPMPPLANEETEWNLGHLRVPYIMSKRAAEDELRKAAPDGDTELVIVNPPIVMAPSSTGDDRSRALRYLGHLFVPSLPQRVNLIDVRDLAPSILSAVEKGRPGERYILGGDNILGRDLILSASSVVEKIPHLVRIPRPVYDTAARFSLWLYKVFGSSKQSFYPDLVKLLDYDWAYSSKKARLELRHSNRSIHQTLQDLLSNNFLGTSYRPHG